MSRPSTSVPSQCAALGGWSRAGKSIRAGSWGAIQGANNANTTKMATSTIPVVARRLRRPRVAAALHVEAKAMTLRIIALQMGVPGHPGLPWMTQLRALMSYGAINKLLSSFASVAFSCTKYQLSGYEGYFMG